jgi:predicted transcriptional regulator
MFEVGKCYRITMDLAGEQTTYGRCEVKHAEMPLIEVTGMKIGPDRETGTTIVNTHSGAFVSAELVTCEPTQVPKRNVIFVPSPERTTEE